MNISHVIRAPIFTKHEAWEEKAVNKSRDGFTTSGTSGTNGLVSVRIKALGIAIAEGFFNGVVGHGAASTHRQFCTFRVQGIHQVTNLILRLTCDTRRVDGVNLVIGPAFCSLSDGYAISE
jgi:hypothetical protein